MKVRISMPGTYMVMDMEEGQARTAFHEIGRITVADWKQGTEAAGRRGCGTGSGIDRNSLSRSGKTGG